MESKYTDFSNAYIVYNEGVEIGRVWYEADTEWNTYSEITDSGYDFVDTFEDAIESVVEDFESFQ